MVQSQSDSRAEAAADQTAADAGAGSSAVRAVKLVKAIDERPILRSLNFDLAPGSFTALLGANGAGKSTLLKVLATLTPVTSGKLYILGQSLSVRSSSAIRARIGMIGHQSMLYRELSAVENLIFFGRLYDVKKPRTRAMELLEYVNLKSRADDPVKTFSRGMVQRVAIARALMHEPEILLADEPFAGLDAPSTRLLENMLRALHEKGHTIILANHDIGQSLDLADQAIVLRGGKVVIDEPTAGLDPEAMLKEVGGP